MKNIAYFTALIVIFVANAANADEVDCESAQVKAKAFLKGAQQEQFAVAQQSGNYGDFFEAMQKIRKTSLPDELLQTIKDALVCEAATESPDWYYVATLFVEAARGEADDTLTPFAEQYIAAARARIRAESVERQFISSVNAALYYLFFVKPSEAKLIAKQAFFPEYWTGEDRLDAKHPNKEMLPNLQIGIVFALAALSPSEALPVLRDLQQLAEKSSDALVHVNVNHRIRSMADEMERRLNGEAPQGMSMYYLKYQGPGAPVIRN